MGNEISAVFNQGILELFDKNATVGFHFTSPDDAQTVEINFFEVDSWVSNGKTIEESHSPPRLIGTTGGVVKETKYHETSQKIPFSSNHTTQMLTVDIDGSKITMPLPNPNTDRELDFFEVGFTVTATVSGAKKTYQSPSPLFVRNTPTPRAELAIVAGDGTEFPDDPSTTGYFSEAAKYWEKLQDNQRQTELSLQSIFLFLREDDEKSIKARNSLPWGRINIVSHADDGWRPHHADFKATWYIKARDSDSVDNDFGFTAKVLGEAELGFPGPRRQEVDEHTEIIIRGCAIGNDVEMLNAIRDKFGGLATVFAPKFANVYRRETGVSRDRLADSWDFSLPGVVQAPDAAHISALLKARFQNHPSYSTFSDAAWLEVAKITAPLSPTANQFRQRLIYRTGEMKAFFQEAEVKNKSQAELTSLMKTQLPEISDTYLWHWTVAPSKAQKPLFEVTGKGVKSFFEILRMRTITADEKTVLVTPNHLDQTQFGRSS